MTITIRLKANLNPQHPLIRSTTRASETEPSTYDPMDHTKNFTNRAVIENIIYSTFVVQDNLNTEHNITLALGKVEPYLWHAEIYNPQNGDGTYDAVRFQNNVPLAYGSIEFNPNGSLKQCSPNLSMPITVQWSNTANPSVINFYFGAINNEDIFDEGYTNNDLTQNDEPTHIGSVVEYTE